MTAIRFDNVSKSFARGVGRKLLATHFREWFGRPITGGFFALRDVSFEVQKGESLGIVGANGAGKSTILSLATGICEPDSGEVFVDGRVAALLELGSGFHPELSGAENLVINASLLGLTRERVDRVFDSIVEFSGVADFIHEPLRTYSTGMVVRLAFSVAVHVDPDVLILDEIVAAGDQAFQARCVERMTGFRASGKTILCVSHSPGTIRMLCDRALWIDRGRVLLDGGVDPVLDAYAAGRMARPATV